VFQGQVQPLGLKSLHRDVSVAPACTNAISEIPQVGYLQDLSAQVNAMREATLAFVNVPRA